MQIPTAADAAPTSAVDVALLRRTVFRLTRRLRRSAHAGITPSQLSALGSVDRDGPLALGDLAAIEDLAPPTLTGIVAKLEAGGLVAREPAPADRRVAVVRITPAGRRLLDRGRRRGDDYLTARLERLDPADRAALARALPVLEALLDPDPLPEEDRGVVRSDGLTEEARSAGPFPPEDR